MKPTILAISGSTRAGSSNNAILSAVSAHFSEAADTILYRDIDRLPHFNPDLDKAPFPPEVTRLRELIAGADAVLICTPEYVFSLPGALKNALEWTVSTTLLSGKPAAFIVASASGQKTFESLDLLLETLLQEPVPDDRKLLIQGSRGKIGPNGELSDAATWEAVRALAEKLIAAATS